MMSKPPTHQRERLKAQDRQQEAEPWGLRPEQYAYARALPGDEIALLRRAAAIGAIELGAPNGIIASLAAHGFLDMQDDDARLRAEITMDGLRALAMRASLPRP